MESHGPICYHNGVSYVFIQHSNVYIMTASKQNSNAASLLVFLHRVVDVGRRLLFPFYFFKFFFTFPYLFFVVFAQVLKHYFEKLEEESLKDNFVVVVNALNILSIPNVSNLNLISQIRKKMCINLQYELLDEIMDFGYPQYTEAKILSEFIKTDAYRMEASQKPPMAVTNAVSWRSEGILYRTNEVKPLRFFVFMSKIRAI